MSGNDIQKLYAFAINLRNYEGWEGNILKKTVAGKTTTFTYDKANQLVSSTDADSKITSFKYDAAGRMISETSAGQTKNYTYGWLDKVTEIMDNGVKTNYSYYTDGQLESVSKANGESEQMYWDDLALVKRGDTDYIVDPAVTGGNPIMANDKVLFNDILGNTLGNMNNGKFTDIQRTAFGETAGKVDDSLNFFTGKPNVEGLGYSFLFRNYRQDLGKWTTQDPLALVLQMPNQNIDVSKLEYARLGYPDGWNNLTYLANRPVNSIDVLGTTAVLISSGNTMSDTDDWEQPETGYNSYANAVAATTNLLSALHNSVYQTARATVSAPQFVIADSWTDSYVIRPMAYGNGQWYIARVATTLTYSVYE